MKSVATRRPYRMDARARTTAATRRSIADAWLALFVELHYDEITLDKVAARAGTTVQTVIRHFGAKDELFAAVMGEVADHEELQRAEGPVGDAGAVIRSLMVHYERVGAVVLRGLEQEDRFPAIQALIDRGRAVHYAWVERSFAPVLDARRGSDRRRLRAQLIALTDIYMWKLLRHDQGFGRRQTEAAIAELVDAVIRGGKDA